MTKQGSLQEVRGRSRVVPGPESDPRGSGKCHKRVIRPDESDLWTGFLGRFGAKRVKKGSLSMALTLEPGYLVTCIDFEVPALKVKGFESLFCYALNRYRHFKLFAATHYFHKYSSTG